ncbi:MAG: hypothetical protein H7146_03025 [Burkholderiaceae bacterium]|nr:hypothetical protein [Microbacteriaceae bacterium]
MTATLAARSASAAVLAVVSAWGGPAGNTDAWCAAFDAMTPPPSAVEAHDAVEHWYGARSQRHPDPRDIVARVRTVRSRWATDRARLATAERAKDRQAAERARRRACETCGASQGLPCVNQTTGAPSRFLHPNRFIERNTP